MRYSIAAPDGKKCVLSRIICRDLSEAAPILRTAQTLQNKPRKMPTNRNCPTFSTLFSFPPKRQFSERSKFHKVIHKPSTISGIYPQFPPLIPSKHDLAHNIYPQKYFFCGKYFSGAKSVDKKFASVYNKRAFEKAHR